MIGLFVGRFQPFQNGHLSVIQDAQSEVSKLIIGIGSSNKSYTQENPYTYEERKTMIESSVTGNYEIKPIPDTDDFNAWIPNVEKIVGHFDVVYTGSPITKDLFEGAGYQVKEVEIKDGISATKVRKMIADGDPWESLVPEGTKEVVAEIGPERIQNIKTNGTKSDKKVASIVKHGEEYVFVGDSSNTELPSEFLGNGENFEHTAKRNVKEQTGMDFEMGGILGVYAIGGSETTIFHGTATGKPKDGAIVTSDIPDGLDPDYKTALKEYEAKTNAS